LEQLQHEFELAGRDEDIAQLAFAMPRLLGFVDQQRLVLRIRGLSHVPGATPLLEDWCRVLMFTYERWREDPTAELTRGDVFRLLDGDSARTLAVSFLLQRESWPFGSGHGGPEDEWSREIISHVRAVRNAHSAADILAARDAIEFPPPPSVGGSTASEEETPAQRQHRIKKAWKLVSENALLASLISGAILLVVGYYVFHSASESSGTSGGGVVDGHGSHQGKVGRSGSLPVPQGRRWREQAGTGGARTFTRPAGVSEGARVMPNHYVEVLCKVYDPEPESVTPNGYWYSLASPPWDGRYYAPANSFWNGDVPGRKPYTHNTDFSVHDC
jgi:hypothetical protein